MTTTAWPIIVCCQSAATLLAYRVSYPGSRGVGHQWSYVPDVARTMIELLVRRDALEPFARFHMGGHWDEDGTQLTSAIRRAVERRTGRAPSVGGFSWLLLKLASPLNTTFREMDEMRHLWRTPVRMQNRRLVATLGHEPHTPIDEAVEATLAGLGCLVCGRGVMPMCFGTVRDGTVGEASLVGVR